MFLLLPFWSFLLKFLNIFGESGIFLVQSQNIFSKIWSLFLVFVDVIILWAYFSPKLKYIIF